jgi:cellulose synthase operon protein C
MKRAKLAYACICGLIVLGGARCGADAVAQPGRRPFRLPARGEPSPAPSASTKTSFKGRFGAELALRLLKSTDPEERLRGVQRACATGTPEAIASLSQAGEGSSSLRSDGRALLELSRCLADHVDKDKARQALLSIVNMSIPGGAARLPSSRRTAGDADEPARIDLARRTAAFALASSGNDRALEALYGAARAGGSGQEAALHALTAHAPREPGFYGTGGTLPPAVARALGRVGDLRALDLLHGAARATDPSLRGAALISLAELGDARAIPLAKAALDTKDARLKVAAAEALVLLGAPGREKIILTLLEDPAAAADAVRLAERVRSDALTKALAARAMGDPDADARVAAIHALGRSSDPSAAEALAAPKLLDDRAAGTEAWMALARSPAANATELIRARSASHPKNSIRAYVVRALVRGARDRAMDDVARAASSSRDKAVRAVGVFARVALADMPLADALADADPWVRRAAVMGVYARPTEAALRTLGVHLRTEKDADTRAVLAAALLDRDAADDVPTSVLVDRAGAGNPDGPLSALALSRRAKSRVDGDRVGTLLGSADPLIRAHSARGLMSSELPDASGRLSDVYTFEVDLDVRRAAIAALAAREQDASAPSRKATLELAARLDPDDETRGAARRALAKIRAGSSDRAEVAWLRASTSSGAAPATVYLGSLVRSDGLAVPIAFDPDGVALVPGVPPGEARLVLAPRVPPYKP